MNPRIVRNEDGSFAVLDVDVASFTPLQRLALGAIVWPQARAILEAAGEYKERPPHKIGEYGIGKARDIDKAVAKALDLSVTTFSIMRPQLLADAETRNAVLEGKYQSVNDIKRDLGFQVKSRVTEGRPSMKDEPREPIYYGKGDRFEGATLPLTRYLRSWKKRDFTFTHVNPKEAKRRVIVLDELLENLSRAREDLAKRSYSARLSLPSRGKRKENTK